LGLAAQHAIKRSSRHKQSPSNSDHRQLTVARGLISLVSTNLEPLRGILDRRRLPACFLAMRLSSFLSINRNFFSPITTSCS
jgi:hypothetical protein